MDKVEEYQQVIINVLEEQPDILYDEEQEGVAIHSIYDQVHHRFMIYRTGWSAKQRINSVILYVHLKDSKIWIEEDWTEDGIVPALLEAGIPKEDIVLGFRHPTLRTLTDFAVA